ncbi:TonB-dependent receptor [Ponticaulis profundi]|uniref:TonB-dependent receptor n=1 Tax=Ponticaulis profundi TaxID=2665222 RepID=A0ABW1SAR2_9PROT
MFRKLAIAMLASTSSFSVAAAQEVYDSTDAQTAGTVSAEASSSASTVEDAAEERTLNAVVVTAQRRAENAQDVPISMMVVPETELAKANIDNIENLPRLASGLYVQRSPQAANTRISIRGIGSYGNAAIEPSVGAYVDGVYIPRPGPLLSALNDIASVEVLRGPQGTLFGRNAAVGALNIKTNLPGNELGGSVGLAAGSFGKVRADGVLNLPVSDTVNTRFSALYDRTDGFGYNQYNNSDLGEEETLSLRGAADIELSGNLNWVVRGDYQKMTGDGTGPVTLMASTLTPEGRQNFIDRLNGLTPRLDTDYSRVVRQTPGNNLDSDQWGISSQLTWDIGDASVNLISSYRDWDYTQSDRDLTFTSADLIGRDGSFLSRSHSEELQYISPQTGDLTYVAGLYYFNEQYDIHTDYNLGTGYCNILMANAIPVLQAPCLAGPQQQAAITDFKQTTDSYAAYGQATYEFSPVWDVTVGLRYSRDEKTAQFYSEAANRAAAIIVVPDSADLSYSGDKVTYRLNSRYRPTSNTMLFATVSTGYKSGGFDTGAGSAFGTDRVFAPETVSNYELGIKSDWLNRTLTANATLFRMDVDDFQLRAYDGTAFSVRNAGSIRQQGAEFDLSWMPSQDLTLSLNGTHLDSEYTSFENAPGLPGFGGVQNLTGEEVPYSPEWQGTAIVDYRTPLLSDIDIGFNGRVSYTSDNDVGGGGDNNPQSIQEAFALVGATVTLYGRDDTWQVSLSGENLLDEDYCTGMYGQTFGGPLGLQNPETGGITQRCLLGQPQTFRISTKYRF